MSKLCSYLWCTCKTQQVEVNGHGTWIRSYVMIFFLFCYLFYFNLSEISGVSSYYIYFFLFNLLHFSIGTTGLYYLFNVCSETDGKWHKPKRQIKWAEGEAESSVLSPPHFIAQKQPWHNMEALAILSSVICPRWTFLLCLATLFTWILLNHACCCKAILIIFVFAATGKQLKWVWGEMGPEPGWRSFLRTQGERLTEALI